MAELITWCRIFRTGPVCPRPCDDCRRTSRQFAINGIDTSLARAHAEMGITVPDERPVELVPVRGDLL